MKSQLIKLVTELQERTNIDFQEIIDQMQAAGITITRNQFNSRYRRRPSVATRYDAKEVSCLIEGFSKGATGCTPFEALLLYSWANIGIHQLHLLEEDLYPKESIRKALNVFLDMVDEEFDYFDDKVRASVKETLPETSTDSIDNLQPTRKAISIRSVIPRRAIRVLEKHKSASLDSKIEMLRDAIWRGDYTEAKHRILDFRTKHAATQAKSQEAQLLHYWGIMQTNQGLFDDAEHNLAKAYQIAQQHCPEFAVQILANRGANASYRGNWPLAKHFLGQALHATTEEHPNVAVDVYARSSLGNLAEYVGQFDNAQQHYDDALRIAEAHHLTERIGYLQMSLGTLAIKRGYLFQAEKHLTTAHSIAVENLLPLLRISTVLSFSHLDLARQSVIDADGRLCFALDSTQLYGMDGLQQQVEIAAGRLCLVTDDYRRARDIFYHIMHECRYNDSYLITFACVGFALALIYIYDLPVRGDIFQLRTRIMRELWTEANITDELKSKLSEMTIHPDHWHSARLHYAIEAKIPVSDYGVVPAWELILKRL